jgi:hypothetical protein
LLEKKEKKREKPLHSENRYQRYNEQGCSPNLSCEHLRAERSENEEKVSALIKRWTQLPIDE